MNFSAIFDSIKGPLASVAASMIPFGPQILGVVNAMLPDDKKLPETATGSQIADAVESLPPEQRASLMEKRIDLQIAKEEGMTERYKAMAEADGQETRARLVNKAMNALIALTTVFISAMAWVYVDRGAAAAFSGEMAAVFGVFSGTFAYVIRSYFGDLRTETKSRHHVIDSKPQPLGAIAAFLAGKAGS